MIPKMMYAADVLRITRELQKGSLRPVSGITDEPYNGPEPIARGRRAPVDNSVSGITHDPLKSDVNAVNPDVLGIISDRFGDHLESFWGSPMIPHHLYQPLPTTTRVAGFRTQLTTRPPELWTSR